MGVAIRGNNENGDKIIKYLKSLGGINNSALSGTTPEYYYYIDKNSNINLCKWAEKPGYKYLLEIPKEKSFELWTY